MARPPRGQVLELRRDRGKVFALRFRAYGKREYVTLGTAAEGWDRERAEVELGYVLADVGRGIWRPPARAPQPDEPKEEPTFHAFASEWFRRKEAEDLADKTLIDLRWSIVNHLLPYFQHHRLSEISAQAIDLYKTEKVDERKRIELERAAAEERGERFQQRPLSNASINHTLRHLAQVLDDAVDYGHIAANPARGKRRRLKPNAPARPWVEPQQLPALLEAGGRVGTTRRGRVLLAILCGAGLRIEEALGLRWRDVDLGTGHIYIKKAKTEKGVRRIPLSPALREELTLWRADAEHTAPDDYVIHTSKGTKHYPSNLRRDVLDKAVRLADVELEKAGIRPIGHATFHGLRRTFASLHCYLDTNPRKTSDMLGHTDIRFTLNVYAQSTLDPAEMLPPVRAAFQAGLDWALLGTMPATTATAIPAEATKSPV